MFEFGRELRRVFGSDAVGGDFLHGGRAGLIELMDLSLLRREAAGAETAARQTSVLGGATERSRRWAEAAGLHREIARRTGEAESLRRSASAAELAWKAAGTDRRRLSDARREQGLTALLGADLFGDAALSRTARDHLHDALAKSQDAVGALRARAEAAMAGHLSRRALAEGDFDLALDAASALDSAVFTLEALAAAHKVCRTEAAAVRVDRAELLLGFGARLREPRLVERARADMADLAADLDPNYEPLSWARARELEGAARVAEGESAGRAEPITEGVRLLADAAAHAPESHSPLDWARLQAALGTALASLGEAADSERAYDGAQAALDRAQRVYDRHPALSARAMSANERASCLARRAERSGDLAALTQAEAAFKAELTEGPARRDPLAWAVAQLNLARIYEARDEIRGRADGREAAVLALSEALEVFTERGLKTLAEAAQTGLRRLQALDLV